MVAGETKTFPAAVEKIGITREHRADDARGLVIDEDGGSLSARDQYTVRSSHFYDAS
jgi:hypothetical protein